MTYVVMFGVEHKIPLYDKMTMLKYLNIEGYAIAAILFFCVFWCIKSSLVTCLKCCGLCRARKPASAEAKEKDD